MSRPLISQSIIIFCEYGFPPYYALILSLGDEAKTFVAKVLPRRKRIQNNAELRRSQTSNRDSLSLGGWNDWMKDGPFLVLAKTLGIFWLVMERGGG